MLTAEQIIFSREEKHTNWLSIIKWSALKHFYTSSIIHTEPNNLHMRMTINKLLKTIDLRERESKVRLIGRYRGKKGKRENVIIFEVKNLKFLIK